MAFKSANPNILVITFSSNTFQIFDVESCIFPEWSKRLLNSLPKRFTNIHDPILGVTFDPATTPANPNSQRALFWGSTWICRVIMNEHTNRPISKKRLRESGFIPSIGDPAQKIDVSLDEQQSNNFKMVTQYRPILHVDFLGPGELVVVERPLVDVLATLPPAYFKPKYGAS
jgi:U3 small nucleolar RNA-associated protein 4